MFHDKFIMCFICCLFDVVKLPHARHPWESARARHPSPPWLLPVFLWLINHVDKEHKRASAQALYSHQCHPHLQFQSSYFCESCSSACATWSACSHCLSPLSAALSSPSCFPWIFLFLHSVSYSITSSITQTTPQPPPFPVSWPKCY